MRSTCYNQKEGWTLLELLIVLLCVIALTAILVYSFVSRVNKQQGYEQVISHISELVNAAHVWRHNQPDYSNISISELISQGILDDDWKTENKGYRIKYPSHSDNIANYPQCDNKNCFEIIVNKIKNPCEYITQIQATNPVFTTPRYSNCIQNEDQYSSDTFFRVIYE